jgi:type II secretory pathway component PulJ
MSQALNNSRRAGFTLVEVLIVLPPMLIITTITVSVLMGLLLNNSQSQYQVSSASNVKTALNTIEQDMKTSGAILTTTDSQMTDAYVSDSGGTSWSYKGVSSQSRTLIIRGYATTESPVSDTKSPVYINQFGCDAANLYSNPVLTTNIIYFVKNGSLYRRVLTDATKTTCNTPYQRQSCPADLPSRDVSCKADDSLILSDMSNFDVQYYTSGTQISNPYSSTDPQVLSQATTVEPRIAVTKQIAGDSIAYTDVMKANKNNSQPYNAPPSTSASPAPDQVQGFTAQAMSSTSIKLTWTALAGATSYQVERATDQYFTSVTSVYSGTAASYTNTGLPIRTTYYYRVRAFNGDAPSVWSSYSQDSTWGPSYIVAGAAKSVSLDVGEYLTSSNGSYTALMQSDGNFVVYNSANTALWASGTNTGSNYWVSMQVDGNLVVYAPGGVAKWSTATYTYGTGRCYRLALSTVGKLTVDSYSQSACTSSLGTLWTKP